MLDNAVVATNDGENGTHSKEFPRYSPLHLDDTAPAKPVQPEKGFPEPGVYPKWRQGKGF